MSYQNIKLNIHKYSQTHYKILHTSISRTSNNIFFCTNDSKTNFKLWNVLLCLLYEKKLKQFIMYLHNIFNIN